MENKLSVATIKGGAAVELVDAAIQQVLENVIDPNTDAKAKRKVTLTLSFSPDRERESMRVNLDVKTSTAPHESVGTIAFIAHTGDGVIAVETRQRKLFEKPKSGDGSVVDINEGGSK